jgi:hypothetical protein
MSIENLAKRATGIAYLVAINLVVFGVLFLAFEFAAHIIWPDENPWLSPPFVKSKVRIANPVYGHTLAPNYAGEEVWGARSKLITDSLGFKDSATRDVPLHSDRKRVLFLGDSFTEGLGTSYEQTFVGRFASAYPQLDVLNGAVSSYSPSIYYAKAKYLLDMGLQIDEILVYIDISDIQDEAIFYRLNKDGHIEEGNFDENCRSPEIFFSASPKWGYWSYTLDFFYKRYLLSKITSDLREADLSTLAKPGHTYAADRARASWTYDANAVCYGAMGIVGGIAKAIAQMDRLYALASERNIPLSVGVYPWPQQMLYDKEQSRQVQIWQEWCNGKCRRFFNHFPTMFSYKREHENFLRDLLIWGDVHYNAFGNELIARDLIAQYP